VALALGSGHEAEHEGTLRYKGGMCRPSEQPAQCARQRVELARQHASAPASVVCVLLHIAVPAQAACATASPANVRMHGDKREEGHARTYARRQISSRARTHAHARRYMHTSTCTQAGAHHSHAVAHKYAHACTSGHLPAHMPLGTDCYSRSGRATHTQGILACTPVTHICAQARTTHGCSADARVDWI
jgi:hypothetical protein